MIWVRASLALLALLAGGLLRWQQADLVSKNVQEHGQLAASLAKLPREIGPWVGKDAELDPIIARATGASDQVKRVYVDRRTGVELDVIVLFGSPEAMFIHAPENCYPASGYQAAEGPATRLIPSTNPNPQDVPFRTLVYSKGIGDRQEVYYSWRLNGQWVLDPGNLKDIQRIGGMLKVQIGRPVLRRELVGARLKSGDDCNPCEDFLKTFLPELIRLAKSA